MAGVSPTYAAALEVSTQMLLSIEKEESQFRKPNGEIMTNGQTKRLETCDNDDFSDLRLPYLDEVTEKELMEMKLDSPHTLLPDFGGMVEDDKSLLGIKCKIEEDVITSLNESFSDRSDQSMVNSSAELKLSEMQVKDEIGYSSDDKVHTKQKLKKRSSCDSISESDTSDGGKVKCKENNVTCAQKRKTKNKVDVSSSVPSTEVITSSESDSDVGDQKSKKMKRILKKGDRKRNVRIKNASDISSEDELPLSKVVPTGNLQSPKPQYKVVEVCSSDYSAVKLTPRAFSIYVRRVDLQCNKGDLRKEIQRYGIHSEPHGWCRPCCVYCLTARAWGNHKRTKGHKQKMLHVDTRKAKDREEERVSSHKKHLTDDDRKRKRSRSGSPAAKRVERREDKTKPPRKRSLPKEESKAKVGILKDIVEPISESESDTDCRKGMDVKSSSEERPKVHSKKAIPKETNDGNRKEKDKESGASKRIVISSDSEDSEGDSSTSKQKFSRNQSPAAKQVENGQSGKHSHTKKESKTKVVALKDIVEPISESDSDTDSRKGVDGKRSNQDAPKIHREKSLSKGNGDEFIKEKKMTSGVSKRVVISSDSEGSEDDKNTSVATPITSAVVVTKDVVKPKTTHISDHVEYRESKSSSNVPPRKTHVSVLTHGSVKNALKFLGIQNSVVKIETCKEIVDKVKKWKQDKEEAASRKKQNEEEQAVPTKPPVAAEPTEDRDATLDVPRVRNLKYCRVCACKISDTEKHVKSKDHATGMKRLEVLVLPRQAPISKIQGALNRSQPLCGLYFVLEVQEESRVVFVCDLCLVKTQNEQAMLRHLSDAVHCGNFLEVIKKVDTSDLTEADIIQKAKQTVNGKVKIRVKTKDQQDSSVWPKVAPSQKKDVSLETNISDRIKEVSKASNLHNVSVSCGSNNSTVQEEKVGPCIIKNTDHLEAPVQVERSLNKDLISTQTQRVEIKKQLDKEIKRDNKVAPDYSKKYVAADNVPAKNEQGVMKTGFQPKEGVSVSMEDAKSKSTDVGKSAEKLDVNVSKTRHEDDSSTRIDISKGGVFKLLLKDNEKESGVTGKLESKRSEIDKKKEAVRTKNVGTDQIKPISSVTNEVAVNKNKQITSNRGSSSLVDQILRQSSYTFKIPKKQASSQPLHQPNINQKRISQDERHKFLPTDDASAWNFARKRRWDGKKENLVRNDQRPLGTSSPNVVSEQRPPLLPNVVGESKSVREQRAPLLLNPDKLREPSDGKQQSNPPVSKHPHPSSGMTEESIPAMSSDYKALEALLHYKTQSEKVEKNEIEQEQSKKKQAKRLMFEDLLAKNLNIAKCYMQTADTQALVDNIIEKLAGSCEMDDPAIVQNLTALQAAANKNKKMKEMADLLKIQQSQREESILDIKPPRNYLPTFDSQLEPVSSTSSIEPMPPGFETPKPVPPVSNAIPAVNTKHIEVIDRRLKQTAPNEYYRTNYNHDTQSRMHLRDQGYEYQDYYKRDSRRYSPPTEYHDLHDRRDHRDTYHYSRSRSRSSSPQSTSHSYSPPSTRSRSPTKERFPRRQPYSRSPSPVPYHPRTSQQMLPQVSYRPRTSQQILPQVSYQPRFNQQIARADQGPPISYQSRIGQHIVTGDQGHGSMPNTWRSKERNPSPPNIIQSSLSRNHFPQRSSTASTEPYDPEKYLLEECNTPAPREIRKVDSGKTVSAKSFANLSDEAHYPSKSRFSSLFAFKPTDSAASSVIPGLGWSKSEEAPSVPGLNYPKMESHDRPPNTHMASQGVGTFLQSLQSKSSAADHNKEKFIPLSSKTPSRGILKKHQANSPSSDMAQNASSDSARQGAEDLFFQYSKSRWI